MTKQKNIEQTWVKLEDSVAHEQVDDDGPGHDVCQTVCAENSVSSLSHKDDDGTSKLGKYGSWFGVTIR